MKASDKILKEPTRCLHFSNIFLQIDGKESSFPTEFWNSNSRSNIYLFQIEPDHRHAPSASVASSHRDGRHSPLHPRRPERCHQPESGVCRCRRRWAEADLEGGRVAWS